MFYESERYGPSGQIDSDSPSKHIQDIATSLEELFPVKNHNWHEFVSQIFDGTVYPHRLAVDQRPLFYLAVLQSLTLGQLVPNFGQNATHRVVLAQTKGSINVAVDFTSVSEKRLEVIHGQLSRSFKSGTLYENDARSLQAEDRVDVILTSRSVNKVINKMNIVPNGQKPLVVNLPMDNFLEPYNNLKLSRPDLRKFIIARDKATVQRINGIRESRFSFNGQEYLEKGFIDQSFETRSEFYIVLPHGCAINAARFCLPDIFLGVAFPSHGGLIIHPKGFVCRDIDDRQKEGKPTASYSGFSSGSFVNGPEDVPAYLAEFLHQCFDVKEVKKIAYSLGQSFPMPPCEARYRTPHHPGDLGLRQRAIWALAQEIYNRPDDPLFVGLLTSLNKKEAAQKNRWGSRPAPG